MPVDVIGWVTSHPAIVLSAVVGIVLITWAYEAADEAEDAVEAAKGFGGRAKSGTGGALNVGLVGLVSLVGWGATTFQTLGGFLAFVGGFVPQVPVFAATVFTISLGSIGLADVIVLKWWHFALIALVVTVLAWAYRADLSAEVGR